MSAPAEFHLRGFREVIAKNLVATWADKSVIAIGIQNQDKVGETVHQLVGKLLLLVKLSFDFAARSDVH